LDVSVKLRDDLLTELEAAELLILGVVPDKEPLAVGMKLTIEFDDLPADGHHPGDEIEIIDAEFGQFAPARAALDRCLDQELSVGVRQGVVNRVELFAFLDVLLEGLPATRRVADVARPGRRLSGC
jgi:hypothetical protein